MKIKLAFIAVLAFTLAAFGQTPNTTTKPGVKPAEGTRRLGFVATNCRAAVNSSSGLTQFMSRSYHVASDDISQIMLAYPNWYGYEQTFGGTETITAAVEYPAGTFTRVTFAGSTSGSVAGGANIFSDIVTIPNIPRGSAFWIRTYCTCSAGVQWMQGHNTLDGANYGTSGIADLTMTAGSFGNGQAVIKPIAIIGYTGRPSILLVGDSRVYGYGEITGGGSQPDATSTLGYDRIAAKYGGLCNVSLPGELASHFITTHALRAVFAQYATAILCDYGVNDIRNGGALLADVKGYSATIAGYFPGIPIYWSTMEPFTASGWTPTMETARTGWNDTLRLNGNGAGLPGVAGYVEVADAVENTRNGGKWVPGFTADGIHSDAQAIPPVSAIGIPLFGNATTPAPTRQLTIDPVTGQYLTTFTGSGAGCTFVFEGDSLTAGIGNPNPFSYYFAQGRFAANSKAVLNVAVNGSTIPAASNGGNNITDRYVANVQPHRPTANGGDGGPKSYLVLMIGTNDICNSSETQSQIVTALTSYVSQAQSDGFTVVLGLITPRATANAGPSSGMGPLNSTSEAVRVAVNRDILSGTIAPNMIWDASFICSNPLDPILFKSDALHYTETMDIQVASYLDSGFLAGRFPLRQITPAIGPSVSVLKTVDQTGIASGATTVIVYDTDHYSTQPQFTWNATNPAGNAVYNTSTGVCTPGVIGLYEVTASVAHTATTGGAKLEIWWNGNPMQTSAAQGATPSGILCERITSLVPIYSPADYIDVRFTQGSGSADTVNGYAAYSTFQMRYVGPLQQLLP